MSKKVEKYIVDNKVGVIYSPGYGAGWSTWNDNDPRLIFSPELIRLILEGKPQQITPKVVKQLTGAKVHTMPDYYQFEVDFLPVGTRFRITEYDGSECIELLDQLDYHTA